MTDRINGCRELAQLLEEQIATANQLLQTLLEEKQVLTGADAGQFHELDTRKRALLSRTEQLEQRRRQLCRRIGVGSEQGAVDYLINDLAASGHETLQRALRTAWSRLRDLVHECRDANEVNGLIAQFKQRQLLQLLGLLRSGSAGLTYGPKGDTQQAAGSRALAQV